MLSTFTYLTDVDETTPAFAVVPKSRRIDNIQILADELGDEYAEVPIHGPAGTCCIVDRSTIHTRLDPLELDKDKQRSRRLYHHVRPRLPLPPRRPPLRSLYGPHPSSDECGWVAGVCACG